MKKCLFVLLLIGFVLSVSLENINLGVTTDSNEIGVNLKETVVSNETLQINFDKSDFNSDRIIRSPQYYPVYGGGFPDYGGIGAGYGPGFGVDPYYGYNGFSSNGGGRRGRIHDKPGKRHRGVHRGGGHRGRGHRRGSHGGGGHRGGGHRGEGYHWNGNGGGGGGRGGYGGGGWSGFGGWGRDGSFEEYSERQKRISDERYEEYWRRIYETGMADETEPLTLQDLNGRLVAAAGEYRHMAVIGLRGLDRQKIWKCGGTLIDFYFVLTAAHCTDFGGKPPTHVKIGDVNLKIREGTVATQRMRIEKIYRHPKYRHNSYYYDIALLRLNKPAIWTHHVRPARLWGFNDYPINTVYALGYGATQFGKAPVDVLTFLNLTMISNEICKATLPRIPEARNGIIESQMCALDLEGKADTCQGDSGGPLQLHLPGRRRTKYYIIGITSYGLFCGSKTPSVYTRIYQFLDWIESIVWTQYNKKI